MFLLTVPAGPPLPAVVSFAGFEDEEITIDPSTQDATLRLSARPIKVKRKQSLKAYMKTAHKQARRESRALKEAPVLPLLFLSPEATAPGLPASKGAEQSTPFSLRYHYS